MLNVAMVLGMNFLVMVQEQDKVASEYSVPR